MRRTVYTAASYVALGGVYAPAALVRRLTRGVPVHVRARLGYVPALPGTGPRAWLHAVSVGEAIAATPLVEGLRRRYPALPLVVTTTTATGAAVVRDRFAGQAEHRFFPLDLPGAARRAIAAIEPAFLIVMETEIWPAILRALARRRTPVMVANGRLSDRSFRRYRLVRGFMRDVLADVAVFAMRSAEDARRVISLGARPERVFVTGNIKHDVAADDPAGAAELWRRLFGLGAGAPVWVAGSTHAGEEGAILDAHVEVRRGCPELALVIAPRHPERVPEVMALVKERGAVPWRRSELGRRPPGGERAHVIVLDTVGELAQLYAVADVVFMGGSFVPAGGHNMLEAAARGKPVLTGPHTENFREAIELLVDAGAARKLTAPAELAPAVRALLDDAGLREKMGAAGRAAVASRHGAVKEILELAGRFLAPPERS